MKRNHCIFILIAFVICMLLAPASSVFATNDSSFIQVEVSTDKETYEAGDEIKYNLLISNISGSQARNLTITSTIPEGLDITNEDVKIEDNKIVWNIGSVKPFGEVKLQFTSIAQEDKTEAPPIETDVGDKELSGENVNKEEKSPQTSDETNLTKHIILLIVSVILLTLSSVILYRKRLGKQAATTLVIAAMLASSYTVAKAEEKKEVITVSHTITIDDHEYEVVTTVEGTLDVDTTLMLQAERVLGIPQLQWNIVENATYQVKRGTSPDELEIISDSQEESFYVDTTSDVTEKYYYQVIANGAGESTYKSTIVLVKDFTDSDLDGLSDEQEAQIGTDPSNPDTDGDGLLDGEEVVLYKTVPLMKDTDGDRLTDGGEVNSTGTNPLAKDTDGDEITDDLDDQDNDTINNFDELRLGTDPKLADTDFDGLRDDKEVELTTDPTNEDTDNDGMTDGNEIEYGTDPKIPDTDGDGTIDGDEVFDVTVDTNTTERDDNATPSLQMKLKGKDIGTVSISNVGNGNPYFNESTPGYIGAPYEFSSRSTFDSAQMTFTIDKSFFDDPEMEPRIYYFNEKTGLLEELTDQTVDTTNGTVSAEVNHFSTYIVLNKKAIDLVWEAEMKPPHTGDIANIELAIGFSIDSSGSMSSNDRNGLRKITAKEFVDKLDDNDKAAVIDFDSNAEVLCELTSDKNAIKGCIDEIDSSGGTSLTAGMQTAIEELRDSTAQVKYVILLTDGVGSYNHNLTQQAKDLGIVVYTIGLGNGVNSSLLTQIAEGTGGKYYFAETAEELGDLFDQTSEETIDLATDSDNDGLSDYHEKRMIRTNVGTIQTDVNNPDTDGDGVLDGEELIYVEQEDGPGYFKLVSNPTEKDSDFDGINDKIDNEPMLYNLSDRTLAMVAGISYTNVESKVGNTIGDLINQGFTFEKVNSHMNGLQDWSIVHANDSGEGKIDMFTDNGLGSIALKLSRMGHADTIIYGIRGTELEDDKLNDSWTDIDAAMSRYSPQSNDAYGEYKSLIKKYPNAEFYLAGHSLGGRVVQDVFYKIENRNESIFKTSITSPIHGATFNALGYNRLDYMLLENDVLGTIKDRLYNYYYKYDLVGEGLGASKYFDRIGTDVGPWTARDKDGNIIIREGSSGYSVSDVHGIHLWLYDGNLNYPNISILN